MHIPVFQQDVSRVDKGVSQDLPTGSERILIVDDEQMIVTINKTVLEKLGYTVTATTDSLEAFEKIRSNADQFDLLVTDQTMPNLTGAELAYKALRIRPDLPIIICTGYTSVFTEQDALAIGIKKYAGKPIGRKDLAGIVRQVPDENAGV